METPAWKYVAALIGVIAASGLAVCNVLAAYYAWTGDAERISLAVVMFVIVDVGVVAFLFGAVWLHRNGHPWEAAGFMVLWAGLSVVSVIFAANYINNRFASALAPAEAHQLADKNAYDEWRTRLETEREHLRAADQLSLNALKQTMRVDAKKEAEASRGRIREIEKEDAGKPRATVNAPVKHELAGRGIEAALAAWIISQGVWFGIAASSTSGGPLPSETKQPHQTPARIISAPTPPDPSPRFPRLAFVRTKEPPADSAEAKREALRNAQAERDDAISRLKASGKKQYEIAAALGIGTATVSRSLAARRTKPTRRAAS